MPLEWLKSFGSRLKPPLPSIYIERYLSGEITHAEFVSNIGDGWIGSDFKDKDWLEAVYAIEQRHNADFPSISLDAFDGEAAKADLRQLASELRARGQ